MPIQESTLNNLIQAVKKVGEPEVINVLSRLHQRENIIDEITDLVCKRMNINKSFLFIKNNRSKNCGDAFLAICFILKEYDINSVSIKNYFNRNNLRVHEIKESFYDLSDNITYQKKLKDLILSIQTEADPIFVKYFYTKNNNHGNQ